VTAVTLNGQRHELDEPTTVESAVRALGAADGRGVAVALDGEVIPRGEWASTAVREGQQIEVLHAVQGGA
jgi:sulfur carrier protein